ncbi:MAG: hypothetical protein ABEH66_05190 [Halobacteriales archaeon]
MAATSSDADVRGRRRIGIAAIALAGLGFLVAGGLPGIAAAVALAGSWYALPAPYAVAIGHLLLAVLLPETPGVLALIPAELGLLGVLGAEALPRDEFFPLAALLLAFVFLLSDAAILGFLIGGLPAAALALVAAGVAIGYGLHRYELLRLGLLDEPTDAPAET